MVIEQTMLVIAARNNERDSVRNLVADGSSNAHVRRFVGATSSFERVSFFVCPSLDTGTGGQGVLSYMATKRMLIDAAHQEETRVALLNGTQLEELDVEFAARRQLKGNIYLAKVTRVETVPASCLCRLWWQPTRLFGV